MGFNEETRQNIRRAGSLDYVNGGASSLPIPRVGYLARIHLHVSGVMTITPGTGTATLSEKGPWNLFRRLRYQIGSGTELFNVSGFGSHLVDMSSRLGYEPEDGQVTAPFASQIFSAPTVSGANNWDFGLTIPIVPNERDTVGLILLQSEGTVTQLLTEWQSAGGPSIEFPIVTTGNAVASFAGKMDVYLETFTVPADAANQPRLDRIHQVLERVDPIFSVGDNSIKLMEENTYIRLIHTVEINGALNTDMVDTRLFRYNVTDTPYELDRKIDLQLRRRQWSRDYPKGVFLWEFFDQGYPNFGGDRDLVQAAGLAELESIFRINSGATLGNNNNVIRTIQQQLVTVATPSGVS